MKGGEVERPDHETKLAHARAAVAHRHAAAEAALRMAAGGNADTDTDQDDDNDQEPDMANNGLGDRFLDQGAGDVSDDVLPLPTMNFGDDGAGTRTPTGTSFRGPGRQVDLAEKPTPDETDGYYAPQRKKGRGVSGIARARQSGREAARSAEAAGAVIEGAQRRIAGFAKAAAAGLAGMGLAVSAKGLLGGYLEAERTELRLKSAIASTGQSVSATMKQYEDVAREVAATTLITREQTLALLAQATAQGLAADEAQKATRIAIALGGATGQEVGHPQRIAILIQRGHGELARRMVGLQGIKNAEELVAKIEQRLTAGWRLAAVEATTFGGELTRLSRSFVGLSREAGGLLADGLRPVVRWLAEAAARVNAWVAAQGGLRGILGQVRGQFQDLLVWVNPVRIAMNRFIDSLGPAAEAVGAFFAEVRRLGGRAGEGLLGALQKAIGAQTWDELRDRAAATFTGLEFVVKNFGEVATHVWLQAKVKALGYVDDLCDGAIIASANLTGAFMYAGGYVAAVWDNTVKDVKMGLSTIVAAGAAATKAAADVALGIIPDPQRLKRVFVDVLTATNKLLGAEGPHEDAGARAAAHFQKGYDRVMDRWPNVGKASPALRQAQEELAALDNKLGPAMNRFVADAMRRFGVLDQLDFFKGLGKDFATGIGGQVGGMFQTLFDALKPQEKMAWDIGVGIGEKIPKGVKHALHHADAAAWGSAEAKQRIGEWQLKPREDFAGGGESVEDFAKRYRARLDATEQRVLAAQRARAGVPAAFNGQLGLWRDYFKQFAEGMYQRGSTDLGGFQGPAGQHQGDFRGSNDAGATPGPAADQGDPFIVPNRNYPQHQHPTPRPHPASIPPAVNQAEVRQTALLQEIRDLLKYRNDTAGRIDIDAAALV